MSTHQITYSSELMTNYLQAEIMRPEASFQALQTAAGNALLFSIGTDKALYATAETTGDRHGWARFNLSAAQTAKDFGGPGGATCEAFSAAQPADGTIDLAMVLTEAKNDRLYLSLGNSASDTSWTAKPVWTAFPYDDPDHPRTEVRIAGVYLSEATDGEYVVVDVVRDPASATPLVFRYFIDAKKTKGYAWQAHDVAVDIDIAGSANCLGRKGGQGDYPVDGIYTKGQIGGSAQLVYAPLYDVFKPRIAPRPSFLHLPGKLIPDAIAACRNADNTSDLYAAANGALYYFAPANQEDGAVAVEIAKNALFQGTRALFAFLADSATVMVWGLNASDEIFYVTCPLTRLTAVPSAWSVPLPILSGVEQVSPYVNRAYSANSFFAHTGEGKLTKAVKSPGTTMWNFRDITLPPPDAKMPATAFGSYTTRIQVDDPQGQPAANVSVSIAGSNVVSVYINHLYYIVGPAPVHVNTDATGSLTIVEAVGTLSGTKLTIGVDGTSVTINPMDKTFQKAASLQTREQLKDAKIRSLDGTARPLIAPGTADALLDQVVSNNKLASQAYSSVTSAAHPAPRAMAIAAASSGSILVDIGDFFSWLGNEIVKGIDHAIRWVKDAATGFWNVVVEIAGQFYHAILNTVEAVVAAVEWIYEKVKIAVGELIKYLEFFFDVPDMRRTKEVIKNLTKLFLNNEVEQIEVVKAQFDKVMKQAEDAVDKWAGLGDWSGLGPDAESPVNGKSTPGGDRNAAGSMLAHHFQGNAGRASWVNAPPDHNPPGDPFAVLIEAIIREGETIGTAVERLQSLSANFTRMPLADALKQLVGILVDVGIESARNVVDTLFDILYDFAKAAVDAFDTPIHIPVLSDILNAFGVPDFSFLDIVCWVAAVPVTLGYKLAHNKAPFPDTPDTAFLTSAKSLQAITDALHPPVPRPVPHRIMMAAAAPVRTGAPFALSDGVASAIHITGHNVSGFCALMSAIVASFEAAQETGENPWAIPSAVLGIIGGVSGGVANWLVPYDPVENQVIAWIAKVTVGTRILCKILFSGPVQGKVKGASSIKIKNLAPADGRAVGAIVDAVLVIPGLVVSVWHFVELGKKPAGTERSIAIVDEVSSLTAFISRVSYAVAVNTEAEVKAVAIGVMAVANIATGGLQIAETIIT